MKTRHILLLAAASLLIIGCNSQKKLAKTEQTVTEAPKVEQPKKKSVQERAVEAQPDFSSVVAQKVRFAITYQKKNISSSGTIWMLKDSLCVISVQPLLGIELARLEATPQEVIFVDKMNKRYVQMSYAEVSKETGVPVTFSDLQNMLMARMFVLGKPQSILWSDAAKQRLNGNSAIVNLTQGKVAYEYSIDTNSLALSRSVLTMGPAGKATIDYEGYALQSDVLFPTKITVDIAGGDTEANCVITLPNLQFNSNPRISRINLSNLKKTQLSTILK